RPLAPQRNVVFQINPSQAVSLPGSSFDIAVNRIRIREPRQIDACANRQPNPFPHSRVDVQQLEIATWPVIDKLDFADPAIIKLFEDLNSALDDFIHITRVNETSGSEIRRVLLKLAPEKYPFCLAVAPHVTAQRVEAVDTRAHDLLDKQRMMTCT